MLNSRFGILLYFLLRNDWTWSLLSAAERQIIHDANVHHNTHREDYAHPSVDPGGQNFDSEGDRLHSLRGRLLASFLDERRPARVVEFGPGVGFMTRLICEHPAVQTYAGVDINNAFLEWLRPRLDDVVARKAGFTYSLHHGDYKGLTLPACDAVVLLSAVHHIPDRQELMACLHRLLAPGGGILAIDPTHYLPRLWSLWGRYWSEYGKREYWMKRDNLATHHFCTVGEYRKAVQRVPDMSIARCDCFVMDVPRGLQRIMDWVARRHYGCGVYDEDACFPGTSMLRFFSRRMAVRIVKSKIAATPE